MVGAWWIIFAFYTFNKLPKIAAKPVHKEGIIKSGFNELALVWKDIKTRIRLKRFLASYFMFNMAVQTVMIMATAFANKEIILLFIYTTVTITGISCGKSVMVNSSNATGYMKDGDSLPFLPLISSPIPVSRNCW